MKRILLLTCFVILGATAVSAQTGAVCIFSDAAGTECNILDTGALVQVYIVHSNTPGATASQFRLDVDQAAWTWLGDMWQFPTVIGTSIQGVSIAYGSCQSSSILLGTVNLFGSVAPPDTPIRIVPDAGQDDVLFIDCDFNTILGAGGTAYVNSTIPCVCEANPDPTLHVRPANLDFGISDVTQTLEVLNIGGGELYWGLVESIPWLSAAPGGGTNDATVTVTVDRTGLAPGVYSGSIDVTSNGGNETIMVYMTVAPDTPILVVSPTSIEFLEYQTGNSFIIRNVGIETLQWNVVASQPWISLNPTAGFDDGIVSVTVDRTGLAGGTHYGTIMVTSNGGDATVEVTMLVPVPEPILQVTPASLFVNWTETEAFLDVANVGTGDLEWSISGAPTWATVNPVAGTNDTQVSVQVDRTGLADGDHSGNLQVTSNGGDVTVPITMQVGPRPILAVDPMLLIFTPLVTSGEFAISNAGDGALNWTLSADKPWIEVVPPLAGTGDATVTVNVDPAAVPPGGTRTGNVTIHSNAGTKVVEIRYVPPGQDVAGFIGVYSDIGGNSCNFLDIGSVVEVHIFHRNHTGATAAQFKLEVPAGWTHLGDMIEFPTVIGSTVQGISIAYGYCLVEPTYLGKALFFGSVASPCTIIRVVPDPLALSGMIEVVGCATNKLFASGYYGVVNPDAYCDCDGGLVPVQKTTWGGIKAMYGDENRYDRGD